MNLEIATEKVWAASLEDRPGSLAQKLEALAEAGVDLGFVIARRVDDRTGEGVVFVTPIEDQSSQQAARDAGFNETHSLHALRVEGPDQPGLGARMTRALAGAGINLRGLSAAALGGRCVVNLAFDSDEDAKKARQELASL
jgi:hypothetical protein